MRRFLMMLIVAVAMWAIPGDSAGQSASYVCEFAGKATIKNGTLTGITITDLECE